MELPYKINYFLIFFIFPFMTAFLLLVIRFLFFSKKNNIRNISTNSNNNNSSSNNNNCDNKYFIISITILTLSVIGFIFSITSFSSWNYVPIEITVILSISILLYFTCYQLIIQFEFERKKRFQNNKTNNNKSNKTIINNNNNDQDEIKQSILLESLDGSGIGNNNDIDNDMKNEDNNNFYYYNNQIDQLTKLEKIKIKVVYFIKDLKSTIEFKPKISISLLALSLVISILIPVTLNGVCICSHPMTVSTVFTRKFQKSYCTDGNICFTYLTLTQDPSTSMILQVHTYNKPLSFELYIQDTSNGNNTTTTTGKTIKNNNYASMNGIIKDEPRFISFMDLVDLIPNTEYSIKFKILINGNKYIESNQYKFKTFSGDEDLKFIVGGDIVLNEDSINLAKLGNKFKPNFIVAGGDIVYEDGIGSCYRRWDEKLSFFQTYLYPDNGYYLIPLLTSIGNHEAGAFFQSYKQVPFYFKYFKFELGDDNGSDTNGNRRKSYHIHKLSQHISITSLDSCVVSTWNQQTDWINKQWSSDTYINTTKFVVYHHPIYPSWTNLDGVIPTLGRNSMLPLFDKYNVPFVFENHEHLFKRTKPMINNTVVDPNNYNQGTTFIGDGAFGISPTNTPPILENLPWYLVKRSYCNHLWFTTITNTTINIDSFSPNGDKIDQITYNK